MSIADFDFYQNDYHGIVIEKESDYAIVSERAKDELARFTHSLPQNCEAQYALKRCACRIAEILYGYQKSTPKGSGGGTIASESVAGYYSVSYSNLDFNAIKKQIDNAVVLYLGRFLPKKTRVII